MSALDEYPSAEDRQLTRYLLGLLPDEEAQQLDEASIVDDEVAMRLRIVEHDLVDAYVTGTLSGLTLQQFQSHYLMSPRRRRYPAFARRFLGAVDRAHAAADPGGWFTPRLRRVSPLMTAAALLLVASGTLLFQAGQLRSGLNAARTEGIALDGRARALERQLTEQRAATAAASEALERVRESAVSEASTQPIALVLRPQTRTIGAVPAIAIPASLGRLTFALQLDSNEFPRYRVALKDPASDRTVWTSESITATSLGQVPTVVVALPIRLLKPQHYSLVLAGANAPNSDAINSYTFEILRR